MMNKSDHTLWASIAFRLVIVGLLTILVLLFAGCGLTGEAGGKPKGTPTPMASPIPTFKAIAVPTPKASPVPPVIKPEKTEIAKPGLSLPDLTVLTPQIPRVVTGHTPTLPGGAIPLGPDSAVFYGTTVGQNRFVPWAGFGSPVNANFRPPGMSSPRIAVGDPPIKVLALMVDAKDHRFAGTIFERIAYKNTFLQEFGNDVGPFWLENSFGAQDVELEMPPTLLQMNKAFRDYFNEGFRNVTLVSNGLGTQWVPNPSGVRELTVTGVNIVEFEVRDTGAIKSKSDVLVRWELMPTDSSGVSGTLNQTDVATSCEAAFDSVKRNWVTCGFDASGELELKLAGKFAVDGAFIRVKNLSAFRNRDDIGFDGPMARPGRFDDLTVQAYLSSKVVPGGFPVTVPAGTTVTVDMLVRNGGVTVNGVFNKTTSAPITRSYQVTLPEGEYTKAEVVTKFLNILNAEFTWVEAYGERRDQFRFRIHNDYRGGHAAVVVEGGTNLDIIGLDGPRRQDGVITESSTNTVRGSRSKIVSEALSHYILYHAEQADIDITAANKDELDQLVTSKLDEFDSFLVLFVDEYLASPIPGKRAGASPDQIYNIEINGGADTYQKQIRAGFMIGTGAADWQTWAHELGHNLGLWDLYAKSTHDSLYASQDYLRQWGMMNSHIGASHTTAWHKTNPFRRTGDPWVKPEDIIDFTGPADGNVTDTHKFTLIPLEYPMSDYPDAGTPEYPAFHVARLELSSKHRVMLEHRMPGPAYSQRLPGQAGDYIPQTAPPNPATDGGLIITDTTDPWAPHPYRSPVHMLNPHGSDNARGLNVVGPSDPLSYPDTLDLANSVPAYDGIKISAISREPGPAGKPDAMQVEVEWGPSPYIELEIRPWEAPATYGTKDIWIDWTGDDEDLYDGPGEEPPVGNGDNTHYHPEGAAINKVRVRVHNNGTKDATGVTVQAKVNTPMGLGSAGKFLDLGAESDPQDIPAGGYKNFEFDWAPKEKGHTCIRAEIVQGAVGDLDLTNNWAQENVTDFEPSAGSPYTPYEFTFDVNNDYTVPADVTLMPTGLIPGMVLELEKDYLVLHADEEVTLRGRLFLDEDEIPPHPDDRKYEMAFAIHAFVGTEDADLPFGGVSVNVKPGYASEFDLDGLVRVADARNFEIPDQSLSKLQVLLRDELNNYQGLSESYFEVRELPDEYLKKISGYDNPAVIVAGRLVGLVGAGDQPVTLRGEVVDAVLVDQDGNIWQSTTDVLPDGRFYIVFEGPPPAPGAGELMLYYFGDRLTSSTYGPKRMLVP